MFRFLLPLLVAASLAGCVTTKFELNETIAVDGIVKAKVLKLHDKAKKARFDMTVELTNLHSDSLILYFGEIRCFKNGIQGRLDYPFFGAGERAIDLKPGETKLFQYTCKLPEKARPDGGEFKLVYGRIFENPNNDGVTSGKLMTKNLGFAVEIPSKKQGKAE